MAEYHRNDLSIYDALAPQWWSEDILGLLPKGTHDREPFPKPIELHRELKHAGLTAGPTNGLGPKGINRRGDNLFGAAPIQTIIYMGVAYKSEGVECPK